MSSTRRTATARALAVPALISPRLPAQFRNSSRGACPRGADAIAADYAARTPGYQVEGRPANWRLYGRTAGYRATPR